MRTLKYGILGTLAVTFALLAVGVVDLCHVAEDGTVAWSPSVRKAAVRKYVGAAWDALTPAPAPEPQAATARR
jgi:hypothetical protein